MYLENHYQDEKLGVRKDDTVTVVKNRLEKDQIERDMYTFIQYNLDNGITRGPTALKVRELLDIHDFLGMTLEREFTTYEQYKLDKSDGYINALRTMRLPLLNQDIVALVDENVHLFSRIIHKNLQPKFKGLKTSNYLSTYLVRTFLTECHFL